MTRLPKRSSEKRTEDLPTRPEVYEAWPVGNGFAIQRTKPLSPYVEFNFENCNFTDVLRYAKSGCTLKLHGGTYSSYITIPKNVGIVLGSGTM